MFIFYSISQVFYDTVSHNKRLSYRLTFSIYRVVSVALFSRHQLTFSTMMATSIMRANENTEDIANIGTIPQFEWQVFLQGNVLANMMDEKQLAQHDGTCASN